MMRRHSWSIKIDRTVKVERPHRLGRKIMRLDNVKKCQHCGLMKGIQKGGTYIKWHNLIYFDQEGRFLSEEKLPYQCAGPQANFLSKEDFYV